ncbi:MAG: hypothetical protein AAGH41_13430 [Pseudomonadota bacterium]
MTRVFALVGILAVAFVVVMVISFGALIGIFVSQSGQAATYASETFEAYAAEWDPAIIEAEQSPDLRATNPDYVALRELFLNEYGTLVEAESFICPNAQTINRPSGRPFLIFGCGAQARLTGGVVVVEMIVRRDQGDWMVDRLWLAWTPDGKIEPEDRDI